MDLGINGRTALVLGGAGGLGRVIAATLSNEGANVAVADINADEAEAVARGFTGKAVGLGWDLADLACVEANVARIEADLGPVDILVALTGGPPPTTAAGQDQSLWAKHFGAMVQPVIAIADRLLPGMRERGWGRIVTSTSSGVVQPIPNLAISNALRMSLVGWSKTLAGEVAKDGVTANVILPGRIATGRIIQLDEAKAARENRTVEEVRAESNAAIPAKRYGDPQEYADAVTFLASERASYINGTILRVDGGLVQGI